MSLPVQLGFLWASNYVRVEDSWCADCAKSSCVEGAAVIVTVDGVEPWGKARRCRECRKRIWLDSNGVVTKVDYPN